MSLFWPDQTEWQPCLKFFTVTTDDGERVWGSLMRRKIPDGSWHYRKMTDQETADDIAGDAW